MSDLFDRPGRPIGQPQAVASGAGACQLLPRAVKDRIRELQSAAYHLIAEQTGRARLQEALDALHDDDQAGTLPEYLGAFLAACRDHLAGPSDPARLLALDRAFGAFLGAKIAADAAQRGFDPEAARQSAIDAWRERGDLK